MKDLSDEWVDGGICVCVVMVMVVVFVCVGACMGNKVVGKLLVISKEIIFSVPERLILLLLLPRQSRRHTLMGT